jgi:hypothetical protein
VPAGEQRLTIRELPAGFYVKEIRYNGSRISGPLAPPRNRLIGGARFTTASSALAQTLEIVLDDKAGTVFGSVSDRDQTVARPYVILAPWPLDDVYWTMSATNGDNAGKFQLQGLPPGEYRAVAVPFESIESLHKPDVLERLLSSGQKITLSEREIVNARLELTKPR